MTPGHPSLLMRLERGMDETFMLQHIEYIYTKLYSLRSHHHLHHPSIKLQIFSNVSKAPFELSKNVADALILSLRYCHIDLDFDFLKDTPELSRLFHVLNQNSMIQSIRMIGILHHPTALWNSIASGGSMLKRIHVKIRANESTIEPLCQALRQNTSLEMVSICCYHKNHILDEGFWKSIQDHPTMTKLHLVAMDHTMFALVSKLAQRQEDMCLPLSTRLNELQLSSLLGGALSHPAKTEEEGAQIWTKFMCRLTEQTPNLQRLGLYSMQSLTTKVMDDIFCHIHPNLQHLDLQGNYNIQSIFFPKWYKKLQQGPSACSQLRQVNIGPQWLTYGFKEEDGNEHNAMVNYLLTLFAKNCWLYQFGGDLECLLDNLDARRHHQHQQDNKHQEQQYNKKEHLFLLADWNRSRYQHYSRQMHSQEETIPIALWPLVLQRMSMGGKSEHTNTTKRRRQASVLNMALQESAAHLLLTVEKST